MKKALLHILIWYFVTVILHAIIFNITQDKLVYDKFQFLFGLVIAVPCSLFGGLWTYSYDQRIKKEQDQALKYRMGGAIHEHPIHKFEEEFCEFYSKCSGESVDKFSQIKETISGEELFEYCNAYYNYKNRQNEK